MRFKIAEGVVTAGWAFHHRAQTGQKRRVQTSPIPRPRAEDLKPIVWRRQGLE